MPLVFLNSMSIPLFMLLFPQDAFGNRVVIMVSGQVQGQLGAGLAVICAGKL